MASHRLLIALLVLNLLTFGLIVPTQVKAQTPLPDLTLGPLGFTFLGKDAQGNCMGKLRINVKNKGNANAGPFTVAFIIRGAVTTIDVAGLQNGSSATLTPDVTVPPGTWLVRAGADVLNAVVESNEVNNSVAQFGTCPGGER
jgi:subtilase family serine protease